jgi:hypothetical protein
VINEELKMHKDFAELKTMQESMFIASKSSGLEVIREKEMETSRARYSSSSESHQAPVQVK